MRQALPIGMQDFRKIRDNDLLYVDKTEIIFRLARSSGYFFLSRPRRFGKSLTLSTLKELFAGDKDLFKGLWIEDHWDWDRQYPVIHLHFDAIDYQKKGVEKALVDFLGLEARKHGIDLIETSPGSRLRELIFQLHERYSQQVVILIDEYDKPIIDYLENPEKAKDSRDELRNFYTAIKSSDAHIRFFMITGVSKFSKMSIFSALNNLTDLTIHPKFSTLVGYTQAELEHYFSERIDELVIENGTSREQLLSDIRHWYNGYSWDGKNFVYNPFSVLSYFGSGQFQNFWFATGTPTFLIKQFQERMTYDVGEVEVGQIAFDSFDLDHIETIPLLFQTGYLTIKRVEEFGIYVLDYPNKEVKDSMLQYMLGAFSHASPLSSTPIVIKLRRAFIGNDLEGIISLINGLFKSIPSHIFIKDKEAYYHSVVFLVFQYLGLFIEAEVNVSDGRIDAVVQTDTHIYVLEFKLDESAQTAIEQIKRKDYPARYRLTDKQILGIGINFSSEQKAIQDWETIEA